MFESSHLAKNNTEHVLLLTFDTKKRPEMANLKKQRGRREREKERERERESGKCNSVTRWQDHFSIFGHNNFEILANTFNKNCQSSFKMFKSTDQP